MATLSQCIREVYGLTIPSPPPDGKTRNFRIDRFRIGFAVSTGDSGVFGCRFDRTAYKWDGAGYKLFPMQIPPLQGKRAATDLMERCVVECARGMSRQGERMTRADIERLDLAVRYFALPPEALDQTSERKPDSLIPQSDIDRANSDVVAVIDGYIGLKKNGKNHSACCPFHQEKSPSFTVSQQKGFYYCFGCGASGDAIRFVMDYLGVGFAEAVQSINGR